MGVGGDGCVVFPAILFPNSRIVNRGTRQQYITKLATSLKKEYEVGRYIASKAPDTGIFPVDDFVEDVAIEDLGPKKYIIYNHESILLRNVVYSFKIKIIQLNLKMRLKI
jgi:hypothetical protein